MMKTIQGYTYKINQHIGKGYSSTVHKGINDKTGQPVSIKVIEMSKLQDPINQMLLQHQITALKKLSFSNGVLHLYDVYATKNNTYIVTELCEGDLGNLLKKRKFIPYNQSVDIIKQIINGYLDVYNVGYVHRDIKPANIFYKGNTYKIGDFGFAIPKKQLDQHKNYNVGSPVYMPPEALKDNLYSVSCDTWAIGIIFYQIIKGVVPWRAISQQKLHQKMISQPLDQLTIGLPQIARTFLAKVLHLDPKMRMTIEEMVTWPNKLASIQNSSNLNLGGQMPSSSPLRQIKNQNPLTINNNINNMAQNQLNINFNNSNNNSNNGNDLKPILTPKQMPSNPFRFHPSILPPPTQKNINSHSNNQYFTRPTSYPNPNYNHNTNYNTNNHNNYQMNNQNEPKMLKTPHSSTNIPVVNFTNAMAPTTTASTLQNQEEKIIQQTSKYASNMVNYLRFLHRLIKFIQPPIVIQESEKSGLNTLIRLLTHHLFQELQKYCQYVKNPSYCILEKWELFLSTQKGLTFKNNLQQSKTKYRMFHSLGPNPNSNNEQYPKQLGQQLIKQCINKLLAKLQQRQFQLQSQKQGITQKSIVALDYLTTFYQLWHIKSKHTLKDFFKMSKIDLIIQGNPYNVNFSHLGQIKRKLILVDIIN